ncbi:MAG: TIGR02300 family protein [Kiloniellales bacterium]
MLSLVDEEDVTRTEWGSKRLCQSCNIKFYDLNRQPIVCPKCGTVFDPEAILKSRRRGGAKPAKARPVVEAPVKAPAEDELEVAEIDEEDEDLLEDTSELGEDDDDVEVVVEPETENER